ncbi:hypothetical protein D3C86_2014090 [compost metagenome]
MAEQGAIEHSERFPRVALPETFGTGGDIGGQGFAVKVQAERLLRHWSRDFFATVWATTDESL